MSRNSLNKIIRHIFTFAAMCSSTMAFAVDGERTVSLQQDVSKAELIRINVPAGDVEITGTTGSDVTAIVTVVCQQENRDNCNQLIKELGWAKKTGNLTELGLAPAGITHYDHVTIKVKIAVPNDKKLEVNLSAGELRINDTSACLTANVNAGEVNINLKQTQLASAELTAKVGDATLTTAKNTIAGERSLLVGANLKWDKGTGACHLKADVLAGEAHLTLN